MKRANEITIHTYEITAASQGVGGGVVITYGTGEAAKERAVTLLDVPFAPDNKTRRTPAELVGLRVQENFSGGDLTHIVIVQPKSEAKIAAAQSGESAAPVRSSPPGSRPSERAFG